MRILSSFLRRHWRKLTTLVLLIAGGVAYAANPLVREWAQSSRHAASTWLGIVRQSAVIDKVYWCPMHPEIQSDKENAACPICNMALVELDGGVVEAPEHLTLTAQQVQQAGVVTEPVMRRSLYREIDTTGRIDYDERRYAGISSWIKGKSRIDRLNVNFKGDQVEQGEVVAEIYSPELITAQQELLIAIRGAKSNSLNSRSGGGISALDSNMLVESARQKLLYQGMTKAQIDRLVAEGRFRERISIVAPINGTVIQRHVQKGQYVNEGDWLFHLADLSSLWLFVDIYEDEIPLVDVGMPVELSVASLPGKTFSGNVAYIEPKVEPKTRTIPVRIDVDNRDGKLLPGMFARARVHHHWPSVLAVPESAVLWSGQRSVVIVQSGKGTFQPREVDIGRKWLYAAEGSPAESSSLGFGEDRIRYHEVLAGLTAGEEIVTAGVFLLNAESQFRNVLTKMLLPESRRAAFEQVVGQPIAARIRGMLNAYFQLSGSLADDKLADVPSRLNSLADASRALSQTASDENADELIADASRFAQLTAELAAPPLQGARDARGRFGRISHGLTKLLAAHGGETLFGEDLYQFECGMANVGYERWLWWSPEIHNPYMGQRMPKCGTKLDALEP